MWLPRESCLAPKSVPSFSVALEASSLRDSGIQTNMSDSRWLVEWVPLAFLCDWEFRIAFTDLSMVSDIFSA